MYHKIAHVMMEREREYDKYLYKMRHLIEKQIGTGKKISIM